MDETRGFRLFRSSAARMAEFTSRMSRKSSMRRVSKTWPTRICGLVSAKRWRIWFNKKNVKCVVKACKNRTCLLETRDGFNQKREWRPNFGVPMDPQKGWFSCSIKPSNLVGDRFISKDICGFWTAKADDKHRQSKFDEWKKQYARWWKRDILNSTKPMFYLGIPKFKEAQSGMK